MTTIAFDGKYLVADRQITLSASDRGMANGLCKVAIINPRAKATVDNVKYEFWGVGFCGNMDHGDRAIQMVLDRRDNLEVMFNAMDCISCPNVTLVLAGSEYQEDGTKVPVSLTLTWRNKAGIYKLAPTFSKRNVIEGSGSTARHVANIVGIKHPVSYVQLARALDKNTGGQIDWIDEECTMVHTLTISEGDMLGDFAREEFPNVVEELVAASEKLRCLLLGIPLSVPNADPKEE